MITSFQLTLQWLNDLESSDDEGRDQPHIDICRAAVRKTEREADILSIIKYAKELRSAVDNGTMSEMAAFNRLYGFIVPSDQWNNLKAGE